MAPQVRPWTLRNVSYHPSASHFADERTTVVRWVDDPAVAANAPTTLSTGGGGVRGGGTAGDLVRLARGLTDVEVAQALDGQRDTRLLHFEGLESPTFGGFVEQAAAAQFEETMRKYALLP